jgi:hypothetical protein
MWWNKRKKAEELKRKREEEEAEIIRRVKADKAKEDAFISGENRRLIFYAKDGSARYTPVRMVATLPWNEKKESYLHDLSSGRLQCGELFMNGYVLVEFFARASANQEVKVGEVPANGRGEWFDFSRNA